MKRITLLMLALVGSFALNAQQVLSHSTDSSSSIIGTVACATQAGVTSDNSWWRSYVLADFGITGSFDIGGVQFGVGTLDQVTGSYDVTINIYLNSGGAFPAGTKTLLGTITKSVTSADVGTLVYADLPSPINVPASSEIVIEANFPDFDPNDSINARLGQNSLGQDAPSYISTPDPDCALPNPTDLASIGFPDAHVILNLAEEGALAVDEQALSQISIYPNPMQDVLNINLPSSVQLESAAMFNLLGEKIEMPISENNTLNTSNLASGVYILKLQTSQGNLTKKVIKQ